jgi:GT2 family glycosyltransferase
LPSPTISIVIPTYERGPTLLDSLQKLLALELAAEEIVVVDQTPDHPEAVRVRLAELDLAGDIRWLRLPEPSIPAAMNQGLLASKSEVVLFLDDDIVPDAQLVEGHRLAQQESPLVAGMVLQPGQCPETIRADEAFRFNSDAPASIREFMGGNFSIRRKLAIALGGFDENFIGAAYRFEAEFANRYVASRGPIRYTPHAMIHHLAVSTGGTRAHGHHLRTSRPEHSAGAYYYLLQTRVPGWLIQLAWRPLRSIRTRHHLRHPWLVPSTLLAELRGLLLALKLWRQGPRRLRTAT